MRWNHLIVLALAMVTCLAKEDDDSNEVSIVPPSINSNVNFRKALLKALIELENEDNENLAKQEDNSEKIVEKASASALSIFTSSEDSSTATTSSKPTTKSVEDSSEEEVLLQKSQAVQHSPITTFEKEELDPYNDAEQILTSASSSFTVPNSNNFRTEKSRIVDKGVSTNSIKYDKPSTIEPNQVQSTTTTVAPSSTEESEAKAEEVQFFSAPLVAAFTVHQDEQGVPKKVESILKPVTQKSEEDNRLQKAPEPTKLEKVPQVDPQYELQQKQKLLEQEILRLNLNLKQQQLLNQQQREILLRQQEEQLRFRSNSQPFLPVVNPAFKQFNEALNTQKPVVNQFVGFRQSLPIKSAQQFKSDTSNNNSGVSFIPSLTFDPIIEAGRLPLNAQVLPIRGAINFHTPLLQTAGFQQFHSIPQVTPLVNTLNQIPLVQPQFLVNDQQGKRIFRQEIGTGNFVTTVPTFSIQKSIQPNNPNFNNNFALVQPQVNRIFRSNVENTLTPQQIQQNPRFFRSSAESTHGTTNFGRQPIDGNHLRNLLYNFRGLREKAPEDINIITKVLTLDHSGGNQFVQSKK